MESKEIAKKIALILKDNKAEDIVSINVAEKTSVADYFVVASGRSTIHTKALVEHLEEELEKEDIFVLRRDGVKEGRWAVLDYGSVIVHIFSDDNRLFYHLENLWGDQNSMEKF